MKTSPYLLPLVCGLALFATRGFAQTYPTNGLLAYYKFDGNVLDSSGNRNDGLNFGATFTFDRFGFANRAILFDNNEVTTRFYPPLGGSNRTVSGWFNAPSDSGQMTLLAYGAPSTFPGDRFELKLFQSGEFALDGSFGTLWTTTSFADGNWHSFIVVVPQDVTLGQALIYMDGIEQTNLVSDSPGNVIDTVGDYPLQFGNIYPGIGSRPYYGAVNDVRIYDYALSSNEVQELYGYESTDQDFELLIVQQPQSQVATWGFPASFSVVAEGSGPLDYQWYFDGEAISGATDSTLTFTNVALTNAGQYRVTITGPGTNVISTNANLVVNPGGVFIGTYLGKYSGTYPGLTITGAVGNTLAIQYSTNLGHTNGWVTITNITLGQPSEIWYDVSDNISAGTIPKRFYRVMAVP